MSTENNQNYLFICQKLRNIRRAKGWSAQKLANKTGVSLLSAQRYEKNRIPPFDYVVQVAELLGGRPSYFFDEKDNQVFTTDDHQDLEKIVTNLAEEVAELKTLYAESKRDSD